MIGSLVKITRQYHLRNEEYCGMVVEYLPVDDPGPFRKIAKINMLLTSGKLWDFFLFDVDKIEVLQ